MKSTKRRDDFASNIRSTLAGRAGYLCSICQANTIGPSSESLSSIANIGVAAHIAAASPGGPRYDKSMSMSARSDIANGIWLCATHASLIDRDCATYTVERLQKIKREHETRQAKSIGRQLVHNYKSAANSSIRPNEYAFLRVKEIGLESYKSILSPILVDKGLSEDSELGILMCGDGKWTVFVNADWLRWCLKAQNNGYNMSEEVPAKQVYGQIPAWPDTFLEFLTAIVVTDSTFIWHRNPDGYLVLAQ